MPPLPDRPANWQPNVVPSSPAVRASIASHPGGDARQLSRAMGAEKFFDAFHERCPDGRASVVALQEVLEAAGLSVTVEEVEAGRTRLGKRTGRGVWEAAQT